MNYNFSKLHLKDVKVGDTVVNLTANGLTVGKRYTVVELGVMDIYVIDDNGNKNGWMPQNFEKDSIAFPFEVDKTTVVNTRKVKKTKTIEVEEDEPTYTVTLTKDQAEALQEIAHHFLKRHENSGRNGVQHQASKLANDTILPVYQSLSKAGLVPFALGGNSDVIKSIRSVQGAY